MVRPALAAARAVQILDFFAAHPDGSFMLSELAKALDINLASTLSVLQALTDAGYLVRHPRHKTYRLGPSLVALGHAALSAHPAVDLARPEMRELAAELSTECVASVVVGDRIVILATEGRPPLRSADVRVGQRIPFVPPIGAIFLAWTAGDAVEAWLGRLDPAVRSSVTPHLLAVLRRVRQRGYSVSIESETRAQLGDALAQLADQPRQPGLWEAVGRLVARLGEGEDYELLDADPGASYEVSSIAAPVFDSGGEVTMALTLSGFPQISGREVVAFAERLGSATRLLTKKNGGRLPERTSTPALS